jgi:4-amino-4-deoxy-L-arabinose transferase-like glycosyltransferase
VVKYAVAAVILITVVRVAVTLRTFSATVDEATHIGAGLEMFQEHRYHFHRHNPPLPRLIFAAIPYNIGMRVDLGADVYGQLLSVFYTPTGGKYERKLVAARVGNLVFLALACIGMWLYARSALDERSSFAALLLFVTQPVILGYSGLATHDVAATAATAFALAAFVRWVREPTKVRAVVVGVTYGIGILCKFSCIAYIPAACAVIALVRVVAFRPALRDGAIAVLVACVVVWAGYGFSVGTVSDLGEHAFALGPRVTRVLQQLDPRIPLPAPQFFTGIALMQIDRGTFPQYLFGRVSSEGWWWYFPAAIALKTPLPFFLMLIGSGVVVWRDARLRRIYIESLLAAVVMIILATNSRLDLGIRYVLPAYVPLTVAAASGVAAIASRVRIAAVLIALQATISFAIHPDYFPYFNAAAGRDPSRYLIDSNLDWGQDVLRLRSVLRRESASHVAIAESGLINYDYLGFPPSETALPDHPVSGWVAVGDHPYRMAEAKGGYEWLRGLEYRRIGKSIRLYFVPGSR